MTGDRKTLSVLTMDVRGVLRRVLTLAIAGMASYWSSCAEQRGCQSP